MKGGTSGLGRLGDQHGLRPPGRNHEPNGTTELLIIYQTFLKENMVQRAANMGRVWFLLDFLASHCPSLTLHPWPQSTWPGTFSLLPSLDRANASSTSNSAKLEQIPCYTPLTAACPPPLVHLQLCLNNHLCRVCFLCSVSVPQRQERVILLPVDPTA